jgi:hypothetical protein
MLVFEWKTETRFNFNLKYQTGSMRHSDLPCFLGPIPKSDGKILSDAEKFTFECLGKEEQEYGEFVTVLMTVLGFLGFALALYVAGFVNTRVVLGCEDEKVRCVRMKEDLPVNQDSWPLFTSEEDQEL